MNTAMYKVTINFSAEKDEYQNGCTGEFGADWQEVREFSTLKEVKEFVKDQVYSGYDYIEYDEYNKAYRTVYTATDENMGDMTNQEVKDWKAGKINGWCIDCQIKVEKYTPKTIGNIKFNK